MGESDRGRKMFALLILPSAATLLATGTQRTTVTWVWTRTTAGWATGARTKALEGVLPIPDLAATTTLAPLAPALRRTPRSATARSSTATPGWIPKGAGTATTASTR